MSKRILSLMTAAILAGSLVSCLEPAICTDEYVYGLEITLVDKETGEPAGLRALVTIRHGDYEENHIAENRGPGGISVNAAGERAGIYDISIEAEGYREWNRDTVVVKANSCHVVTVKIIAELISEEP